MTLTTTDDKIVAFAFSFALRASFHKETSKGQQETADKHRRDSSPNTTPMGMKPTMNHRTLHKTIDNCDCNYNWSRRNRNRRSLLLFRGCSLTVVVVIMIATLFVLGYVQGLTPSKPPSTTSRHTKQRRTKNNLSSSASSTVVQQNEKQTVHRAASAKFANTHHNKKKATHCQGGEQVEHKVSQVSIFVKNLHYQAEKADIVKACKKAYGNVKSVWIPRGNNKKGYAKVEFEDLEVAKKALANGRLNVLGRHAYLVQDNRPVDTKGDAFRFLAAFAKGDFDGRNNNKSKVFTAVDNAGTPRSEKERGILAASLARMGARDELLRILQWKNRNGNTNKNNSKVPTSVFNAALSAMKVSSLQECKLTKEIVAMAEAGPGVNSRTYATAIASIKRGASSCSDDLSKAASSFLETALDHGVANHVVYNELISCLGKTGAWKMATRVLDQMFEDDGVEPTEVSLNSAIASCAFAGQMDAAQKIYDEDFPKANIRPTIVTTNALVNTVHKWIKKRRSEAWDKSSNGRLDPSDAEKAMSFVRRVLDDASQRGDELDLVSINTLVSTYGAAGDIQSATRLFKDAYSEGKATTVTANAVLSAFAMAGDASRASNLVQKLESTLGIRSDVTSWNTAISACGVGGYFETAKQLFEAMPHSPDAHSYASLLSAVADKTAQEGKERGDKDATSTTATATVSCVHDLLERADKAKVTTTYVLNAALVALDRLGDSASVQLLFEEGFQQRGLSPDVVSYNTAIHLLGRNDPVVAVEIFLGMIEHEDATTTIEPEEQSYCAVISALANSGLHQEALRILQSCPSKLKKSLAMHNEALRACQSAAEPEAALQLLRDMKSDGPEPNLVSTTIVMNTCAKAGREYEAGFSIFEDAHSPDLIAFNSAIALAEKSGDANKAISLLKRLVREEAEDMAPDAISFCSAIAACERSKERGGTNAPRFRVALRLLKESIKAVGPNAACYIATVQTLAAAGKMDHALDLLTHDCVVNFDNPSKYVLYRTVQVGCSAAGDSVNADNIGNEMQDFNLKALAPLASARIGGRLRNFDNKIDSKQYSGGGGGDTPLTTSADVVANTVQDLVRRMDHQFVTSALPIEFQANSSQKGQEISLANHAEKKALARLLLEEKKKHSDGNEHHHPSFVTLSVEINFKMCADCHSFFKGASEYLERRITVKEPTMLHVFEDGECSCNNSWRWEERHAFEQTTEAIKIPGLLIKNQVAESAATKHRFGRLPPLLKP